MGMAPTLHVPSGLIREAEKAPVMDDPGYPNVMSPLKLRRCSTASPEENSAAASGELSVAVALSMEIGPVYEPPLRYPGPRTMSPAASPRRAAFESNSGITIDPSADSSVPLNSTPVV